MIWIALALVVFFLAGLSAGWLAAWKHAKLDAKQILESQLPSDPTGLAGLVANRAGTRFAAVMAGDTPDAILVAVAVNKTMPHTEELHMLAAAALDLHESIIRQLTGSEARAPH